VAFSPDNKRMITGSADQSAKVWDLSTGKEIYKLTGHHGAVMAVAFSHDGKRLLTGSADGIAIIWDAADGRSLLTFKRHGAGITSVAFSPDDSRIATGNDDTTAKIWDAGTGKALMALDAGGSVEVRSVAFSTDGQRVVVGSGFPSSVLSGSEDQSTKVWDAISGLELLTLKSHGGAILCIALSPDGRKIATGSWNHSVEVWSVPTMGEVANWEANESMSKERLRKAKQEAVATFEEVRSSREHDPGALKSWLVLLPTPIGASYFLDTEQIPEEARLEPHAGEHVVLGGVERDWVAINTQDGILDCEQIFGIRAEFSVTYAVCYIYSQKDQPGLSMQLGNNSLAKVYLNGDEIYRRDEVSPYQEDPKLVTGVRLHAGKNVLVYKMWTNTHGFKGFIRLISASGGPLEGISHDPPGPESGN
jgi:hypothetical protein